jgi:hypothetical protein
MTVIPALREQRQEDGKPGLHNETLPQNKRKQHQQNFTKTDQQLKIS